jgi:tetratricopeptide (TPR) repeat protein
VTGEQSQRPPYPGLRAFRREETDLFFGREDCTNAMVDRLARTRFLAVLGSSGTGKSSLVRTGLLDALELGLMAKAGSRWKIVDFRPGGSPLKNLARRLLETQSGEENPNIAPQDVDLLRAFLARGPRAVIEWCRSGNLPKDGNLLLLVDQFEELFRYQDYAGREEAEAFVALLLESAREPDAPIYVTITMRSEYLGACALIEGLSDAINAGMFLTPRMSRDHCRDAIVGPAEVCNIDIEPALVNRLLNDLANFAPWDDHDAHDQLDRLMRRADQLPLLQYTLNRMWQRAHERSPGARVKLTVDDYVAIEGLGGALNAHANQIFEDLGKPLAQVAEWVFRALTAGSTLADAVRRPTRLDELIADCGGDEAGVRAVVDAFRAPGVNFLLPEFDPHNPKIAPDTYIDISHESLIRQWKKLSEWLGAEGRAAQQWRRLVDRYGTGDILRGRELANLIAWRTETKPNAAWAQRYGGDYPAVIAYLDKSQRAQNTKRVAVLASTAVAFMLVTGFGVDATLQRNTIAKQSAELKERLAETQVERASAQANKRQVIDLLETVIFNIAVPLTSSDGGASHTTAARRGPEAAQSGTGTERGAARPSLPVAQEVGETENQPSADRATTQVTETRNPSLAAVSTTVQSTRRLADSNPDDIEIKRLFAVSLNVFGDVLLQVNDPKNAPANIAAAERAYNEGLSLVRAMLKTDPDMILWKDDLVLALVGVARVKMRVNNHGGARTDLEEAIAVGRGLSDFMNDRDDRVLRHLQIHLGYLGDTYINLKMRPEARAAFEERLLVRRKRLAAKPDDPQLQTDVSVALDRVGQLVREQGDPNSSRTYFEEALKIDRALHQRSATRRDWQENLVFSLTRIGDLDRQLGRQREALTPYEEALELQRRLAADATVIAPQQTLASLLGKIGDIKRRLRDFPAAVRSHREELDIRRKLLARDPNSLAAKRNVSSALDYLGNTLRESNDLEGARTAFNDQLDLDRAIAKVDPNNVTSLTDLAWSLNRLGDLDRDASKPNDATKYYEEALAIQRQLIAREPDSLVRMRDLASIVSKLGSVRSRTNDHTTALTLHQEELDLRRKVFQRASDDDNDALRNLSLALDRVGNVLRDMSDFRSALKYFEEELSIDRRFVTLAPDNLTALGDLQWTLNKLSDFVRQRLGDRSAARKYIEEMIGIDRRLIDRQPTNKERYVRLKDDLVKLANLLLELSEPVAAREAYGEVFVANERWLGVARENFMKTSSDANRGELVQAYGDAGWNGILAGRATDAIPHLEAALSLNPDTPWNTVNLAHAYLFQGRYAEAVQLYASVRDRHRSEDGKRTYAHEIRDDFAIFRRLGLARPEMARAERELRL